MKLSLFDTHCDTAYELYQRNEELAQNSCHVSLSHASAYEKYVQLFAVWSHRQYDDQTCWEKFLAITENFDRQLEKNQQTVCRIRSGSELDGALATKQSVAILAVEDARLLAGDIDRLQVLYDKGVRCMTLLWGGPTCIGGSHDTEQGLTDFGKAVLKGCFELGIVPDISHASEQSVDDVIAIAQQYQKPFIATHSNSYSAYAHTRNLRDRHLKSLIELGGTVGVSMCCIHLRDCSQKNAGVDDVIRHIERYLALGAENNLCFGCDWDGTDLPDGMTHVDDLYLVANALQAGGYSQELINKLFWQNAYEFFKKQI